MLFSGCTHIEHATESTDNPVGQEKRGSSTQRAPNIIVILVDDLGYGDIEPYGEGFSDTPHLDQLAPEEMTFTENYTAASMNLDPENRQISQPCWLSNRSHQQAAFGSIRIQWDGSDRNGVR
ncbi:sulfatase-like hydrolase/transferase [Myxococcota bacterium]|nr:sulfatase-like hydrolase/transferase [Myxococcota bacterium]